MSKPSPIKWRKIDIQAAKKAIKNYNQKIDYWKKKAIAAGESAEYLPEKLTYKELRKQIKTRKEYNKRIKDLIDFSKPGAEKKVKPFEGADYEVTAWELNKIKKAANRINRIRKKHAELAKKVTTEIAGTKYQPAELKQAEQKGKPVKIEAAKKRSDWKKFAEWAERESKKTERDHAAIYQDHYFAAIESGNAGLTRDQQAEIKDLFGKVGAAECMKMYYQGVQEMSPEWVYDEPIDSDKKFRRIRKILLKKLKNIDFLIDAVKASNMTDNQKSEIISLLNSDIDYALDKYEEGREELDPDWITNSGISGDEHYNRMYQLLT